MYCGHDGWFAADLIRVGNTMVVRANGPVTPGNIVRDDPQSATHQMVDCPGPLFWCPQRGIFVVPNDGHIYELKKGAEEGT
jgi:hypothetical protein